MMRPDYEERTRGSRQGSRERSLSSRRVSSRHANGDRGQSKNRIGSSNRITSNTIKTGPSIIYNGRVSTSPNVATISNQFNSSISGPTRYSTARVSSGQPQAENSVIKHETHNLKNSPQKASSIQVFEQLPRIVPLVSAPIPPIYRAEQIASKSYYGSSIIQETPQYRISQAPRVVPQTKTYFASTTNHQPHATKCTGSPCCTSGQKHTSTISVPKTSSIDQDTQIHRASIEDADPVPRVASVSVKSTFNDVIREKLLATTSVAE